MRTPGGTPAADQKPAAPPKPAPPPPKPPYVVAWTESLGTNGPFTLTLTPTGLVVATEDAPLQAYSLDDGHALWTAATGSDIAPLTLDDLVIGLSGQRLHAVDEATGAARWSVTLSGNSLGPAAIGRTIAIASGTVLGAYRPGDGSSLWQVNLGATATARIAVSDAMIVVALSDRSVAAFEVQTGRALWRVPLEIVPSVLAISAPRVYFGTADGYVCALKAGDGRLDWCFSVKVPPVGPPAIDAKSLYFAFLDGGLRVFAKGNGARRQNLPLNARPQAGPQVTGTDVVIPVVTAEFVLLDTTKQMTAKRVAAPAAKDGASLLASAARPDGAWLAMVTVSPAGTALVCLKKTPPATTPAAAPAAADGAAQAPTGPPGGPPADGAAAAPAHAPRVPPPAESSPR